MKIIIIYGHHYKIYNHKDLAPLISNAVDYKAGEDGERLKHLHDDDLVDDVLGNDDAHDCMIMGTFIMRIMNNAKDTLNREGVEQRVVMLRLLLKFSAGSANC